MVQKNKNAPTTEEGRRLLMARRSELISALTGRPAEVIARSDRVADDDHPTVLHDEFVSLETNRIAFRQLRLVDAALALVATGDYGLCQDCGERISPKRLRALPWAEFCIDCEERLSQLGELSDESPNKSDLEVHSAREP